MALNEIKYTYDKEKRISKVINVTGLRNDAVGNRIKASKNGVVTDYTYNGLNQLTSEISKRGDNTLSNKTYTYDANGNQVSQIDSISNEKVSMEYNEMDMMRKYVKTKDGVEVLSQENLE